MLQTKGRTDEYLIIEALCHLSPAAMKSVRVLLESIAEAADRAGDEGERMRAYIDANADVFKLLYTNAA